MVHVEQAIVVEGRYDKNTLSQIVDTVIFQTNGFSVMHDRELLALLRERYGWTALPPMERTGNGKPFFPGHPQVHFSISHTAGAAAVAVSDAPVGVDIQHIQTPPRRLAYLTGLEEPEAFFRSWAQWEARAKRTGTGILDMVRRQPPLAPGEVCTEILAFPGYMAASAGAEPEQVRRMTVDGLLRRLDI